MSKYNEVYAESVRTIPGCTWLNIYNDLLWNPLESSEERGINIIGGNSIAALGPQLIDDYKFDDTHIHPDYVSKVLTPVLRSIFFQ